MMEGDIDQLLAGKDVSIVKVKPNGTEGSKVMSEGTCVTSSLCCIINTM